MISANFGVAVITIALRGLLDRFLSTPVEKFSVIPHTSGFVFVSATVYLLYKQLVRGHRLRISYPSFTSIQEPSLSGRIRKKKSLFNVKHRNWFSRKSRSRSRENLLDISKESLDLLNTDGCSTCSSMSKINEPINYTYKKPVKNMLKCDRNVVNYCIEPTVSNDDFFEEQRNHSKSCHRFAHGDWEPPSPPTILNKTIAKKNKVKNVRQTRSGCIYASYI